MLAAAAKRTFSLCTNLGFKDNCIIKLSRLRKVKWVQLRSSIISASHSRDEGCCRNKWALDSWRMKHKGCCKTRANSFLWCSWACKFIPYSDSSDLYLHLTGTVLPEITRLKGNASIKLHWHVQQSGRWLFLKREEVENSLCRKHHVLVVMEKMLTSWNK